MRTMLAVLSAMLGALILSAPVSAHHGSAAFDVGKQVVLKGTVTRWVWANPHCFLAFDVKSDDGAVTHWVAEGSNPPSMVNLGWSKETFKAGDEITATVEPVKTGRPAGRLLEVVLPDGKTLHEGTLKGPGN